MTNRIFARSNSNVVSRNSELNFEQPFNFALKHQLAFSAELESQLLKLEQRFLSNLCTLPTVQQRLSLGVTAIVSDANVSDAGAIEPCTYDDFGLVEGLELDVHWM